MEVLKRSSLSGQISLLTSYSYTIRNKNPDRNLQKQVQQCTFIGFSFITSWGSSGVKLVQCTLSIVIMMNEITYSMSTVHWSVMYCGKSKMQHSIRQCRIGCPFSGPLTAIKKYIIICEIVHNLSDNSLALWKERLRFQKKKGLFISRFKDKCVL